MVTASRQDAVTICVLCRHHFSGMVTPSWLDKYSFKMHIRFRQIRNAYILF